MIKCSTCGKHVKLRKENRYEVVIKAEAWQKSFGAKDRLYDAFDCPRCGCQMLMHERFPAKNEIKIAEERADECNGCCAESDDDVEESVEEDDNHIDNKDLSCDYDYNAMTKEELVKLCKERGVKISSVKYVEKQTLIDKLVKNDKFMEGWE